MACEKVFNSIDLGLGVRDRSCRMVWAGDGCRLFAGRGKRILLRVDHDLDNAGRIFGDEPDLVAHQSLRVE